MTLEDKLAEVERLAVDAERVLFTIEREEPTVIYTGGKLWKFMLKGRYVAFRKPSPGQYIRADRFKPFYIQNEWDACKGNKRKITGSVKEPWGAFLDALLDVLQYERTKGAPELGPLRIVPGGQPASPHGVPRDLCDRLVESYDGLREGIARHKRDRDAQQRRPYRNNPGAAARINDFLSQFPKELLMETIGVMNKGAGNRADNRGKYVTDATEMPEYVADIMKDVFGEGVWKALENGQEAVETEEAEAELRRTFGKYMKAIRNLPPDLYVKECNETSRLLLRLGMSCSPVEQTVALLERDGIARVASRTDENRRRSNDSMDIV